METTPSSASFAALGIAPALLGVLAELGYEEPTPIQREAIPHLLTGRDLLGQAATGTGKTAAFALPLLQRLEIGGEPPRLPEALVLVPTRELAMQVAEAMHRYGRRLGVQVLSVYGGQPFGQQLRALRRGVHVVVATPGRTLDHIGRGTLALDGIRTVVLDEADEMLDMGFAEALEEILSATPGARQTVLFSATLPPRIAAIAGRHLREPVRVKIAGEKAAPGELPRVRQTAYIVPRAHKSAALTRVLDMEDPSSAILFCRTRNEVDELTEALRARGYEAQALHGGFSQEHRDRVMARFRAGTAELLVATDVAARGLDIEHVSHVINYDVPCAPEVYVHRIGRTGRAGREGAAITLVEPREHYLIRNVERLTGQRIEAATLPTVADLRARRLELTRASLREALIEGGAERFRVVVEGLADEFDVMDIAAAAVKLAHDATEGDREEEEAEIPSFRPPPRGPERARDDRAPRGPAGARGRPGEAQARPRRETREARETDGNVARLYVSAGRNAGIRPADLVGAIANEASLSSRDIGAIEIADGFSTVEVPADAADAVIEALRATRLKGRKVQVRRDDAGSREARGGAAEARGGAAEARGGAAEARGGAAEARGKAAGMAPPRRRPRT
ncbi:MULTISPECIES: DEAD/DEAH box helicase [Sorangium]|uniref:DEAD-box ATP-dependent RNA helicase RhpA n=1 Tax=Sorangium cellulosum (strain So ce56) TaxID=448385 RepID=A9ENG9_SORC5|nr:DEAD/DEAH box helicase [Sorangium cellulosum]CAN90857.1 ATP-independent RNA helicase [Sorangium cellulosum So ce56]